MVKKRKAESQKHKDGSRLQSVYRTEFVKNKICEE